MNFRPAFLAGSMLGLSLAVATPVFAASPAPDAPFKLRALKITGNQQVSTADIEAALPFHVGDTVTPSKISEGLQDVMAVYKKANVGGKFGQAEKFTGKDVAVTWQIEEQAPAAAAAPAQLVIDSVVFSGNKSLTADQLTAATALRPGSVVSNDAVAADQKAILAAYKKKGVSASINMSAAYPAPNHVVLTWAISEQ